MAFKDFCISLKENQSFFDYLQGCVAILSVTTLASALCLILAYKPDDSTTLNTTLLVVALFNASLFLTTTSLVVITNINVSISNRNTEVHGQEIAKLTATSSFLVEPPRNNISPDNLPDGATSRVLRVNSKVSQTLNIPPGVPHQAGGSPTHLKVCGCPGKKGSSVCPEHESGKVRLAVRKSTTVRPAISPVQQVSNNTNRRHVESQKSFSPKLSV